MVILRKELIQESSLANLNLRYVYEEPPGYSRIRRGSGFSYLDEKSNVITNEQERERLAALAIPPSYNRVWYCPVANGHLQATGYDSKDHKQYFYHELWEKLREQTKFQNMHSFGEQLPTYRRKIRSNLKDINCEKETILAAIGRVLDRTGMRIGSADNENKTYGLTTLHKSHVDHDGSEIELHYVGKGGVEIEREFHDAKVGKVLDICEDIPGQKLFKYQTDSGDTFSIGSTQVNTFIKDIMGDEFSAKDFRTWRFSCLFLNEAKRQKEKKDKVTLKEILETISELTGNTPAVLQSSYVHPGLIDIVKNDQWKVLDNAPEEQAELRQTERIFLLYLQSSHAKNILMSEAKHETN